MARSSRGDVPPIGGDALVIVNESPGRRRIQLQGGRASAESARRLTVDPGQTGTFTMRGPVTLATDTGETVSVTVGGQTVVVVRSSSVLVCE